MRIATLLSVAALAAVGVAAAPSVVRAQFATMPPGSYSQTCVATYSVGERLYSSCRNTQGAHVRSSIALSACTSGDIANMNGILTCGGTSGRIETAGNSRPPTPAVSVTVYSSPNFRGQSQTFTTAQSSFFATTWSRQISSMRLTGGWQACTEQNYRGRCQSFAGQVSNLRDVDFDDVIMSIRPLR